MADRYTSASIAGYEDGDTGEWFNVEAGASFTDADLEISPLIAVRVQDTDGEWHYYTTSYLTDDFDLDDAIDQFGGGYDEQFV